MRRIFTFLMCVSGLSLAVTYTHSAEPAAADDSPVPATTAIDEGQPAAGGDDADNEDAGPPRADSGRNATPRQLPMAPESLVRSLKERLEELRTRLDDAPNNYKGQVLEGFEHRLQGQIEQLERTLDRIERADGTASTGDDARPAGKADWEETTARARRMARDVTGRELARLRELAEKLEQSATEETANARTVLERRIDELEHYLAERRERRDAVAESSPQDDDSRPVARLRHLRAAIEHLQAAGLIDQAHGLKRVAAELEAGVRREQAIQQAADSRERAMQQAADIRERAAGQAEAATREATRASRKTAAADDEVRELSQQVGLLRRELRRLRAEVDELRQNVSPE